MMPLASAFVVALLLALTLRRLAWLVASQLRPAPLPDPDEEHPITVIVPARNEAAVVPRLLEALERLEYSADRLRFVLVSDGSTDDTAVQFRGWAAGRADTDVLELRDRTGKAGALNAGLRAARAGIVVTLDADLDPASDFLREIVRPFADPTVGGVAGYLEPVNADRNLVTRYAALTTWVHQLVTSAGTDRLGLNPPTLGAAAFRREALEDIGGFPLVCVGEDVATSEQLSRRGWRIRFVRSAVARNVLVADLGQYWHQHTRWSRSTLQIAQRQRTPARYHHRLQVLEATAAAAGYADRIVLLLAMLGTLAGTIPAWAPVTYLALPGVATLAALRGAAIRSGAMRFLAAAALIFAVDVAASVTGVVLQLAHRPYRWHNPRQAT